MINAVHNKDKEKVVYSDLIDDFNNLRGGNLVTRIEKEIKEETPLADKARYMLYRLQQCVPKMKKDMTLDGNTEIKKAAENGYKAAKIRCSLDFKMYNEEEDYRCKCLAENYMNEEDSEDVFVIYEVGVAHLIEKEHYPKAVEYIKKSADMGCWLAERSMGIRYENGSAVEQNYALAMRYHSQSHRVVCSQERHMADALTV